MEQSAPALLAMDVERLRADLTTQDSKANNLVPWSPPVRTNAPEDLAQIWESPKASETSAQPDSMSPEELPKPKERMHYKQHRQSSLDSPLARRSAAIRHDLSMQHVTKRRDLREEFGPTRQKSTEDCLESLHRPRPDHGGRRRDLHRESASRRHEMYNARRPHNFVDDYQAPDQASHLSEPRPRRSASLASSLIETDGRWIDSLLNEERGNALPPDLLARVRRTNSRHALLQPTATHTRHRSSTINDNTGQATELAGDSPAFRLNRFLRTHHHTSPELLSPGCRLSPSPSPGGRPCSAASFVSAVATARELQRDETRVSFLSGPQSMPLVASPSPLLDVAAPLRHKARRVPEDLATAVLSSLQLAREIEGRWGRSPVRNSAPATPWKGRTASASLVSPSIGEQLSPSIYRRRYLGSSPKGLANPNTPRLLPYQNKPMPAPPEW